MAEDEAHGIAFRFEPEIERLVRVDTDAAQSLFYEHIHPFPVFTVGVVFAEDGKVQIRALFKFFPKSYNVFVPDLFGEQFVQ